MWITCQGCKTYQFTCTCNWKWIHVSKCLPNLNRICLISWQVNYKLTLVKQYQLTQPHPKSLPHPILKLMVRTSNKPMEVHIHYHNLWFINRYILCMFLIMHNSTQYHYKYRLHSTANTSEFTNYAVCFVT